MKIGIYSGSFNPVHVGHIALADHLVNHGYVDEVWLIRSPQNPLKPADGLMSNEARLEMLRLAIIGHKNLKISTVEDTLPVPNYTITTLRTLQEQHPEHEFHLIVGADNWLIFQKWRDWQIILRDFHLIVYPRPGYELPTVTTENFPTVRVVDAPQYDISSTQIRQRLAQGLSLAGMVDTKVEQYLRNDTT
ncbi:MAG: nicotinate-nucleotide adenylyltransferase [Bacteroidales bacterium]|nr:nicotinate-nucleotide adenylyltransferase [Bacteroidales bacterium]